MKKLLGILVMLLWCNVGYAEYCKDDDPVEGFDHTVKSYAEHFDNYYVPEESYKFGLKIQEAVKNKDLDKLLSLIKDDLISGPKMSFFDNKTYDEAFPVSFRGAVLMNKPRCWPVAIFPSSYMCHKNPLSIFQCDQRVTTSQVSSNNSQYITSHKRLAERFKLSGHTQKVLGSSAKIVGREAWQ